MHTHFVRGGVVGAYVLAAAAVAVQPPDPRRAAAALAAALAAAPDTVRDSLFVSDSI